MANQITGKIIHIFPSESIPSKDGQKLIIKRSLLLDCTTFDQYTGERGYENTPLLEFMGEEKCSELNNYQPGQVVTVSFGVQGTRYVNKEGVENVFTSIRPYKIELKARAPHPQPQHTQQAYQQPQRQPQQQSVFPPRVDNNGVPF